MLIYGNTERIHDHRKVENPRIRACMACGASLTISKMHSIPPHCKHLRPAPQLLYLLMLSFLVISPMRNTAFEG